MLGSLLELHVQWRRVFSTRHHHWRPVTAGRKQKVDDLAQLLLPFPSLLVVRNTITCNNKQNRNNIVDFSFCFTIFRSASLLSPLLDPFPSFFLPGLLLFPSSDGRSGGGRSHWTWTDPPVLGGFGVEEKGGVTWAWVLSCVGYCWMLFTPVGGSDGWPYCCCPAAAGGWSMETAGRLCGVLLGG